MQPQHPGPPEPFGQPPTAPQVAMPPQMAVPAGASGPGTGRKTTGELVGLTIATCLLATVVAVVIGVAVGIGTAALFASDGDPGAWEGLESIALGALFGLAASVVFYIVAAVLIARALIPAGQRTWPIVSVIIGPPIMLTSLSILGSLGQA